MGVLLAMSITDFEQEGHEAKGCLVKYNLAGPILAVIGILDWIACVSFPKEQVLFISPVVAVGARLLLEV